MCEKYHVITIIFSIHGYYYLAILQNIIYVLNNVIIHWREP